MILQIFDTFERRTNMRKFISSFLFGLFIFSMALLAGENPVFLKIQEPPAGTKAKTALMFDLETMKRVVDELAAGQTLGSVEFVDQEANVLASLAKIKNGKIEWTQDIIGGNSLLVKFKKPDYDLLLSKVKEKAEKPGYLIQFSDVDKSPQGVQDITFLETSDLAVSLTYPFNALPGEILGDKVSVEIENKGTVAAKDVGLELVLSTDLQMPAQAAVFSGNFKEDCLLEGGREVIPAVQPGEKVTVKFKGSLKVPDDTPLGRYYLGAVADPENKLPEADKENNKDIRLFMVTFPEPKRITLELPDTQLVYIPGNYGFSLKSNGVDITDAKEWRKCNVKPFVFQVKHALWEDFHWELDSFSRLIWHVTGAEFCKKGGTGKEVKYKMEVKGGSKLVLPNQVSINIPDTKIEYEPVDGKFRILTDGYQTAYLPFWQVGKVKPLLYHFKHKLWTDFFWEIDAKKLEVRKITGVEFGKEGGTAVPLNIKIIVEQAR